MSKCRPDCCSGSSGDGSGVAIIGVIVLVAAAYGIIQTVVHAVEVIVHIVIEIMEITAITAGSITVIALLAVIVSKVVRHHRDQLQRAGAKVTAINLANPLVAGFRTAGENSTDAAELFAEAVASPDMDPRFVEKILRHAMEGPDQ